MKSALLPSHWKGRVQVVFDQVRRVFHPKGSHWCCPDQHSTCSSVHQTLACLARCCSIDLYILTVSLYLKLFGVKKFQRVSICDSEHLTCKVSTVICVQGNWFQYVLTRTLNALRVFLCCWLILYTRESQIKMNYSAFANSCPASTDIFLCFIALSRYCRSSSVMFG